MFFLTPQSFIFFSIYTLFIFLILCSDTFFIFWSLMEIRTLVFMGMRYSLFKNNFSQLLTFFIIQTISAFSVLVFYVMGWNLAFTLSLILKLSIFPFHFWYLNLIPFFPNLVLFMSRTIFKIPSMLLLLFFYSNLSLTPLMISVVLTIFVGAMAIIFRNDLRFLLIASSVANNSWFILSMLARFILFSFYLFFYSAFLFLVLASLGSLRSGSLYKLSFSSSSLVLFSLVSIAGIPPFPVFFIKMCSVIALSSLFLGSRLYIFFIMLFSVFMLLGYLKFCFSLIINVFTNQQSFIFSY